jgi:hypothetical protein
MDLQKVKQMQGALSIYIDCSKHNCDFIANGALIASQPPPA